MDAIYVVDAPVDITHAAPVMHAILHLAPMSIAQAGNSGHMRGLETGKSPGAAKTNRVQQLRSGNGQVPVCRCKITPRLLAGLLRAGGS